MFSLEEGKLAIKIARETVENHVAGKTLPKHPNIPESFKQKSGVFVTINTYPGKELRGCIGYPEPIMELIDALTDSAINASTEDPRFPPVDKGELGNIVIEVSLLSVPKLVEVKEPKEYLKKIKIGRDGLIVSLGYGRGLLLPQVPVEWKWGVEEFLGHTCMKAGLNIDSWKNPKTKFYSFSAQIFVEKSPRGEVEEEKLEERK
ncbi:MAG: TIGR00296 family protein [Thermoplasmata archaeon]